MMNGSRNYDRPLGAYRHIAPLPPAYRLPPIQRPSVTRARAPVRSQMWRPTAYSRNSR